MSPTRRPLRLPHYDYSSPGGYFLTMCTERRACLFGSARGESVQLSLIGQLVSATWSDLPAHCPGVRLDVFTVMPNHLHAIVFLQVSDGDDRTSSPGRTQRSAPTALPDLVRRFKTLSTARARSSTDGSGEVFRGRLWQRTYYEHVIRNDDSLDRIREYIVTNPVSWAQDRENPEFTPVPERQAPPGEPEPWMV